MDFIKDIAQMMATVSLLKDMPNSLQEFLTKIENTKSPEHKKAKKLVKKRGSETETAEIYALAILLLDIVCQVSNENLEKCNTKMSAKETKLLALKLLSESILKLTDKIS